MTATTEPSLDPDREPNPNAMTDVDTDEDALEAIPYISDVRAEHFRQAGYETPTDVATAELGELADDVYGIGATTARQILEGARELVGMDEPVSSPDTEPDATSGANADDVDADQEPEPESEPAPVDAETFARRLVTREVDGGSNELWYRDPETQSLITPYHAPGFEAWCEAHDRDPESFRR